MPCITVNVKHVIEIRHANSKKKVVDVGGQILSKDVKSFKTSHCQHMFLFSLSGCPVLFVAPKVTCNYTKTTDSNTYRCIRRLV